ncbi:hypothetical protein NL676_008318 [Syzygium grande]|nr:hypothetical protein NL676_008318 [Syzygium grande]
MNSSRGGLIIYESFIPEQTLSTWITTMLHSTFISRQINSGSMAEYLAHAVEEEEPTIITRQHCAIPMRGYAMTRPHMQAGMASTSRKQHTGGFSRAWRTVHRALVVAVPLIVVLSSRALGRYDSIISFGDSLADTGNLLHPSRSDGRATESGFLPYSENYFRRPTGRFSDGRLVIDFVAERLGLPYVAPYYGDDGGWSVEDFRKRVNFAVGGGTALDVSFSEGMGMGSNFRNESLRVQLGLFKELLPSLCITSSDCKEFLGNSLVLLGEIGGNDYNHPLFMGRDPEEIRDFVPLVVEEIGLAISV